jgi:hypothetical protein
MWYYVMKTNGKERSEGPVGSYKYKSEEAHQRHLEYRRQYYAKNRERIRAKDNANAKKNRAKDPERYRGYVIACKQRKAAAAAEEKDKVLTLDVNPEKDAILEAIAKEQGIDAAILKKDERNKTPNNEMTYQEERAGAMSNV